MKRNYRIGEYYIPAIDRAVWTYLRDIYMNHDDFARDVMGMGPNTFSSKRRGLTQFSLGEATRLAKVVGLSLNEAMGLCGAPDRPAA